MFSRLSLALLIPLAACGGSDDNSKNPDAAVQVDARAATVMEVTCPATVPITVTVVASQYAYTPGNSPIPVGGIVMFTMGPDHNVVPNVSGSDPGLVVNFNQTKCLKFTAAGTFGFHCQPHGFQGSITVQ